MMYVVYNKDYNSDRRVYMKKKSHNLDGF